MEVSTIALVTGKLGGREEHLSIITGFTPFKICRPNSSSCVQREISNVGNSGFPMAVASCSNWLRDLISVNAAVNCRVTAAEIASLVKSIPFTVPNCSSLVRFFDRISIADGIPESGNTCQLYFFFRWSTAICLCLTRMLLDVTSFSSAGGESGVYQFQRCIKV